MLFTYSCSNSSSQMSDSVSENTEKYVQVLLWTKLARYKVNSDVVSVPSSIGFEGLSQLICSLMQQEQIELPPSPENFDFLLQGVFLRTSLAEYIENNDISSESVIEIEYTILQTTPEPYSSLHHDDWVSSVQAFKDYILCGCYNNQIKIWKLPSTLLLTIPLPGPIKAVCWISNTGSDYSFVTCSHDCTTLVWKWNSETNQAVCVSKCRGHVGSVDCVAVDQSLERLCTGSWDTKLNVWVLDETDEGPDVTPKKKPKRSDDNEISAPLKTPLLTLSGHKEGISGVQWLATAGPHTVCTCSWDHTIKLWDASEATCSRTITGSKVFLDLSYSSNSRLLLTSSADRYIRLYDPRLSDGALVQCSFSGHTNWVSAIHWSPHNDHNFISGSYDERLLLWDTRSPKVHLFEMEGHADKIFDVDWSVQSYLVSGSADETVKVFRYSDTAKTS